MSSEFEWVLEDCLQRLRRGQSPEDCLAAYPDQIEGLGPLLQSAAYLRAGLAPQPRPQAIQAGRERMLVAAKSNSIGHSFTKPVSSGAFSRYKVRIFTTLKTLLFGKETHGMKFALRLAIDLAAILMIGGVVTANASAHSLPGDPLYSVKRTWEEVRLTLTLNDAARQQLQDQIRQLRLEEVQEMIRTGRTGIVEFEGLLESITANEWVVSSIRVVMLPDTIVEGNPEVGQLVRVRARLQNDGTLTAMQVRVQAPNQSPVTYPPPSPSHTPEPPRPTVTAMPSRMPSRTSWPTHTWEPTHEPNYEPTHMPWPTYEPTQQPWPTENHHDGIPGSTPWPNDDHRDDDDQHHHDDQHNDSDGSPWSGSGSGSHHSWP